MVRRGGTYFLYYSAGRDDTPDVICLAVATSTRPQGPFRDSGRPLHCGNTGSDIDAATFHDPRSGSWLLYWGSGGDIAVGELSEDLLSLVPGSRRVVLEGWSASVVRPFEVGIEGPFVVLRDGWYYLFYSGDSCCEYPPHYAPLVVRARDPMGPFERPPDGQLVLLRSNERWAGPGHNSVVRDDAGVPWFAYHAIDRRHPYLEDGVVRRVMLIERLRFAGGWPAVGDGSPSTVSGPPPRAGR